MPTLNPAETEFLRMLLKEHLDYYRLLGSNTHSSEETRRRLAFLEALWSKIFASDDEYDPRPARKSART